MQDDAFKILTEKMEDDEIREACLNPESFYRQLWERQAELANGPADEVDNQEKEEEITVEEKEEEITDQEEKEKEVTQEKKEEPVSAEEGDRMPTHYEMLEQVAEAAKDENLTELEKIKLMSLALAAQTHIADGQGDVEADQEEVTDLAVKIAETEAFQTVYANMSNQKAVVDICKNPGEFLDMMFRVDDILKEQKAEAAKEEEKAQEKEKEKEQKEEEKETEKEEEKITESESGIEETSDSYEPLYTEKDYSKEAEELYSGFTVMDYDDFDSPEEAAATVERTPAKVLLESVKTGAQEMLERRRKEHGSTAFIDSGDPDHGDPDACGCEAS